MTMIYKDDEGALSCDIIIFLCSTTSTNVWGLDANSRNRVALYRPDMLSSNWNLNII